MSVYDFDYDYPDPPVDTSTNIRCVNPRCWMFIDGETWHPTTFKEYQGDYPHGGYVDHYTDDSDDCPECSQPGEEI